MDKGPVICPSIHKGDFLSSALNIRYIIVVKPRLQASGPWLAVTVSHFSTEVPSSNPSFASSLVTLSEDVINF